MNAQQTPGMHPDVDIDSLSSIKGFVACGLFVLALFGGGAVYWAMTSKLDGAIVAPASFVVEGNRKTVEHLEGGIVRDILVKDGDFVEAGQTLVTLDSTDLDVDISVISSQIGELEVRRARLLAQFAGYDAFAESDVVAVATTDLQLGDWAPAFAVQKQLFEAAKRARQTEADILAQRIDGLTQQIAGLEEQRGSTNEISALRLTDLSAAKQRDEAITTELATVEAQLAVIAPQYRGAAERLKRIAITAPVSGQVVGLSIFTTGGVVRPGTAFDLGDVPEAIGTIVDISADSFTDERTDVEYYLTRIKLDDEQSQDVSKLELLPGMPADIFVNTGEKTALAYLTQPISDRLARTFIE